MKNKTIGIIGLGHMGTGIAQRLLNNNFIVIGYDPYTKTKLMHKNFKLVSRLEILVQEAKIMWLMVPAGEAVNNIITSLQNCAQPESIIIDGGNSFYKDSLIHYHQLLGHGIHFLDCGVSGGINGFKNGFSLMVGGDKEIFDQTESLFKIVAAPQGYLYCGPAGAGHYVKMIHNGIEYGLLEAYAEGFRLLREGHYPDLDLIKVSEVWQHGAIINSYILKLIHEVLGEKPDFKHISGEVQETGTARWMINDAQEKRIELPVIKEALEVRIASQKTGGNFATKLIALLRNKFGGHSIKKL